MKKKTLKLLFDKKINKRRGFKRFFFILIIEKFFLSSNFTYFSNILSF
jgi:hypothetical protein